jgi:carbon monoxide dehydrogenase subunit G
MSTKLLIGAVLCATTATVWAHGPTRQKVTETVTVAASPEAVWERIGDFGAMHGWHPVVESTETTNGSQPGSIRTLHLKGGGTIVEELTKHSAEERRFSYRMKDPGPLPVTNYSSTLSVAADTGGKSVVEWRGAFYRGDPNGDPAPEKNDEAAIAAVTGVYKTGLENLKKLVEGK